MKNSILSNIALGTIGLAIAHSASAAPEYALFGDLNDDCIVDKSDVYEVYYDLGNTSGETDINNDGIVDVYDYYLVYGSQTTTCGRRLMGDVDGSGVVDSGDLLDALGAFGSTGYNAHDINGDMSVNQIDIDMITAQMGATMGRRVLGDVNGDYIVNTSDVLEALSQFGSSTEASDLDQNGAVTRVDLNLIRSQMGETACSQLPGDANGDKVVNVYDLIVTYIAIGSSLTQFDCDKDGAVTTADYYLVNDALGTIAGDTLEGDINGDWVVDDADIDLIDATYGEEWAQADIDGNGTVAFSDLSAALGNYGIGSGEAFEADIDMNCATDAQDLQVLVAAMGTDFAPADINGDGLVNTADVLILQANYGQTCE
jgi:hypothetical protein